MTQEQRMRRMIQGFLDDPPDTPSQQGFLAAALMIATEIMGIEWNDPLILSADELVKGKLPDVEGEITKAKAKLTVIDGGRTEPH